MDKPAISIIGTGAFGSVFARALNESGWPVKSLFNRSPESAASLAEVLKIPKFGAFPSKKQKLGRIIFLTVPDDEIEEAAKRLSALNNDFSGYIVAHCSGNQPSSILKSIQEKGAQTAAFHPIQTYVSSSVPSDFEGIYIDVEGNEKAVKTLHKISNILGANFLEVAPDAKPYLHVASVMASNYVISLMKAAGEAAALGGLDKRKAQQALIPLMQKSLVNMSKSDNLREALSGPIARGDAATVADHIKLLKQNKQISALYKQLGEVLVQLLEEEARLTENKIKEISNILNE